MQSPMRRTAASSAFLHNVNVSRQSLFASLISFAIFDISVHLGLKALIRSILSKRVHRDKKKIGQMALLPFFAVAQQSHCAAPSVVKSRQSKSKYFYSLNPEIFNTICKSFSFVHFHIAFDHCCQDIRVRSRHIAFFINHCGTVGKKGVVGHEVIKCGVAVTGHFAYVPTCYGY
jgi:hypothetical protein